MSLDVHSDIVRGRKIEQLHISLGNHALGEQQRVGTLFPKYVIKQMSL